VAGGGAGGETIQKRLRLDAAEDARDALAKAVYAALFRWLVNRVNAFLAVGKKVSGTSLSILDIYGFECFTENSFEQLCINYANERLQQQFNRFAACLNAVHWNCSILYIQHVTASSIGIRHLLSCGDDLAGTCSKWSRRRMRARASTGRMWTLRTTRTAWTCWRRGRRAAWASSPSWMRSASSPR
jgi:hypothetical protein